MDVAAIVQAADAGRRPGSEPPAALRLLGGVPLVAHIVAALRGSGVVDQIVVVAPPDAAAEVLRALDACLPSHRAIVLPGASSRHRSLHIGLSRVDPRVSTVLLSDVLRPLVPEDLIVRVVKAVHDGADVAVPVLGITETVKELDPEGRVVATLPRERLVRLQAPRAVRRSLVDGVHGSCAPDTVDTDGPDQLAGVDCRVVTVLGDDDAFAVLRPPDLAFAEAVLARRQAAH